MDRNSEIAAEIILARNWEDFARQIRCEPLYQQAYDQIFGASLVTAANSDEFAYFRWLEETIESLRAAYEQGMVNMARDPRAADLQIMAP
jgi:hypothetical protein